jgi:hypothetical protein
MSPRRVNGAKRASLPGMPWFKCFTNKWYRPKALCQRYNLTEEKTGFVPSGLTSFDRREAEISALIRLRRRKRTEILAAIARVKRGFLDPKRIPQNFRFRIR